MIEIRTGMGKDRNSSAINSEGYLNVLMIKLNKLGGAFARRSPFAGASARTANATNEPAKAHPKMLRSNRRNCASSRNHIATIAKTSIVMTIATGGSENPPMMKAVTKHIISLNMEGDCFLAFQI